MTLHQGLAFALIAATVAAFAWGKFRYDMVALVSLLAGLALQIIPVKSAFNGFKTDVVVIIATALVVSAAIAKSGIIEVLIRPLLPRLKTERAQVPVLTAATTVLSAMTKNVGALAILMPAAMQVARRSGTSPSRLLMPMSFGALVGGLVTLVGTSTNIIVSQIREEELGTPFKLFDFAPVGLCLALIIFVYLAFAYRLLPTRQGTVTPGSTMDSKPYVTEARIPENWSVEAATVAALRALGPGEVQVAAVVRDGVRREEPRGNVKLMPGDILVLEGGQWALDQLVAAAHLQLARSNHPVTPDDPNEEVRVIEAVIEPESILVGRSAKRMDLHQQFGVNLIGVSRAGARITQQLRAITLRAGDVIVLQAGVKSLPTLLRTLGCLPLAEREVRLGRGAKGLLKSLAPSLILALAMVLVGFRIVPIAQAFFGAAIAMVAISALTMREAYDSLDAPVLVMIAALVPVSEAVQATGGTDLLATTLSHLFQNIPPLVALGLMMLTAMLSAPFLHNAPTVLILGPVAVGLAKHLGLSPDPFLMAVATGAGCDFLTPIGHQCNTLIMGPGGYKFGDYARLGAPLSVVVILLGAPLIAYFWPLVAR